MNTVPSLKTVIKTFPVTEKEQSIKELVEHFKVFYFANVF
jgi:hypothetical protein